jgi:hypothetical protein
MHALPIVYEVTILAVRAILACAMHFSIHHACPEGTE